MATNDEHSGVTVKSLEPTLTESPDARDMLTISHVVTESIIVACVILLSLAVLIMLTMHDRIRKNFFNQLLASLALGTFIFSLFVRPGTIHEEIRNAKLTQGYCGLYLVLLDTEWIMLPYTLLFLTIERIIVLREPHKYAERMTKTAKMSFLIAPWAVGIFFGIIRNFAMNEEIQDSDLQLHKNPNHLAQMGCYVVSDNEVRNIQILMGEIIGNVMPIIFITGANIVLISIYCRKRTSSQLQLNLEISTSVHSSTIIITVASDIAMVVALINNATKISRLGSWVVTHWLFSAVEILLLILSVTLLPEIRNSVSRLCFCYDVRDEYRTLINVHTSTQTTNIANNQVSIQTSNPSSDTQVVSHL